MFKEKILNYIVNSNINMKYPCSNGFFITGTNTNVGKTTIAVQLLQDLNNFGFKTAALKPIATGSEIFNFNHNPMAINSDALKLQKAASLKFPYDQVNPLSFVPPIAPHLAAEKENITLTKKLLYQRCNPILQSQADFIVVEGAGGWKVPINYEETMADFAKMLGFPVILVVKLRLGCLNEALLTYESILNSQLPIVGWIANSFSKNNIENVTQKKNSMSHHENSLIEEENIESLKKLLPISYWGKFKFTD